MSERVILCYGDSNTHGTMPMETRLDRGRFGPGERWPGVMAAELGDGWRVIEEGLPGRTTVHPDPIAGAHKNGLMVLPAVLESHLPIDLVVLMLGTNDMKARFQVPIVEMEDAVGALVRAIQTSAAGPGEAAPGVLLIAPPPVLEAGCLGEIFAGCARKSTRFGEVYAAVARRHGTAFLDAGQVIASSPVDGVHYDAAAHGALGRAAATAVRAMAV